MSRVGWLFTLNNPEQTNQEYIQFFDDKITDGTINYCIFQKEKGTNGTPHLQGYLEFTSKRRLGFCKGILPRAHWEPRKGSREQARDYCSKNDTREEGMSD